MENNKVNILDELNDSCKKWNIRIKFADELFDDINDIEGSISKFKTHIGSIYLITVSNTDIEKYIKYPGIYKLMIKYRHTAENRDLQFIFFKINEMWIKKKQEVYEKFKELYWDMIVLDESEYYLMIWYFWWTQWRTNQEIIKNIQNNLDVKDLNID